MKVSKHDRGDENARTGGRATRAARRRIWLKKATGLATYAALQGGLRIGAGVGAGAGALGVLGSGAARAQGSRTLRIGFQKYGNLVVLKARGTLEKRLAAQGFGVQWLEFPGGPQLLEGLNAGAIDVGVAGETPPIFAQAGGVDFVYVASEPPAPKGEAIVVPHASPVRTVAGLRGKRVALNKGSNVHYLLVKALQRANLGYGDIQPVYLAPADARAAFTSGSVDAWVIWDPYFAAIERQAGARVIADGEGLVRNTQYYLASRKFAQAQPQIVHALLDEIAKIDTWARENVQAVAAQLSPLVGLDAATLEVALRRSNFGVRPVDDATLAYQQQIADTFTALKLIPKKLVVADARWRSA